MRFARLQCESDETPAGLEELAAGGDLDFLQLDYPRPRTAAVEGLAPAELPAGTLGFTLAARTLVKTLFLEPELRVVTSAGWADAYGTAERAAAMLSEGGCSDLLVSAVRGSNLLPILDMLVAEHVDLKNANTGAPWKELREPILAADLQLGAGPLVTAFAENARVVVAGCFDEASPATAAAVAKYGWSWNDFDRLAAAALAARAAAWCDWQPRADGSVSWPWTPRRVELDEAGHCLASVVVGGEHAAMRMQQWLNSRAANNGEPLHADVRLDLSSASFTSNHPQQIALEGATGSAHDGCWRLEVLHQTGYAAEAMIEFATTDVHARRHLADLARNHLQPPGDAGGLLTVESLQPLSDCQLGWLHAAYQSKSRQACQYFADQTLRLTAAHPSLTRMASGPPRVHVHCGLWSARVPRDAVDIAVETRLAKEWV